MHTYETMMNGIKDAQFFMNGRLIAEIARMKGNDGPAWIEQFRQSTLKDLSEAKQQDPAAEGTAETIAIADTARSVINATCDLADWKLSNP